jgi:glyoxylase-like metal-dependent hydrolase (beta-lactamase superfamily II)
MFKINHIEEDITFIECGTTLFSKVLLPASFNVVDNVFIDTGNSNTDSKVMKQFIDSCKGKKDWMILNTHLHEDHCGYNYYIHNELNAEIVTPEPEGKNHFNEVNLIYKIYWGKPKVFPYTQLKEDSLVTERGWKIHRISTPGHSPHHCSYFLENRSFLYTGDAIPLAREKAYSINDENFWQAYDSLKILKKFIEPDMKVISGHMKILKNPIKIIDERLLFMDDLAERVQKQWISGERNIDVITFSCFKRRPFYDFIVKPRMCMQYTIKSLIDGLNE